MADNILKGIVQIDTSQASANLTKLENDVKRFGGGVAKFAAPSLDAFRKATDNMNTSVKKMPGATNQATQSLVNLSRVAQDAPYGFIGIANNINPLLESFQRLKVEAGSNKGALQALKGALMGPAGIGLAVGAVSSLMVVFGDKLFGTSRAAEKAKSSVDELQASINGAFKESAKEATQVGSFVAILKSETETRERKLAAVKELQRIQPEIFAGLKVEGNTVAGLDNAYKNYLANLKNVIATKIIQARIDQKIEDLLKKQGVAATKEEKALMKLPEIIDSIQLQNARKLQGGDQAQAIQAITGNKASRQKEISALEADIQSLFNDLGQYTKNIKVGDGILSGGGGGKGGKLLDLESFVPTRMESLNLGKAIVERIQEGLMGVKTPLTFNEILANKINADISKLVVTPNIKIAYNKKAQDDELKRQESLKNTAELITGVVTPAFQNMFSTIASGGNAFKAFGEAAAQALMQVISKLLTTAILSAILGPLLGAGSAMGASSSKFGDVFKFLMGGGGLAGMRANGGPVQAGKRYLVGERGMEIFTPSTSGMITPNHAINSYSGGGMAGMFGSVVFEISGNRLVGVLANAGRSQGRLV